MTAVTQPLATATAALLGAGVIAAAPLAATAPLSLPTLQSPEIALQASIIDILGFPVYQQAIANEVEFVAIRAAGLAAGGAGLVDSLLELPAALITATQQTLSGDPLAALTTIEDWVIGTGSAALVPPVLANIDVGQIQLAIQSALLLAQPTALVQLGSGIFTAFDTISRSFIVAGQDLVSAVLSLNIGNIVQAVVGGVTGVVEGFLTGGQGIIDGIAAAQTTLVTALQARPGPVLQPLAVEPAAAAPKIAAAAPEPANTSLAGEPAEATVDLPLARAEISGSPVTTTEAATEPDRADGAGVRAGRAGAHRSATTATVPGAAAGQGATEASPDDDGATKADAKRAATR